MFLMRIFSAFMGPSTGAVLYVTGEGFGHHAHLPWRGCYRVPGECPQLIADLVLACTAFRAGLRPSAQVVMETIERSLVSIPGA